MQLEFSKETKLIEGLKVIVVDDVTDSRELLEMYLQLCNVKVIALERAKDVLELVKNFKPDVIVSDIYMPEENGYWLIEQLNEINQQSKQRIQMIALTAAATEKDRKRLIKAGYDGYIAKPFILEDLTGLITELIARKN